MSSEVFRERHATDASAPADGAAMLLVAGDGQAIPDDREQAIAAALVVTVAAAAFVTLWLFRAYDDNRLVSWHWALAEAGALESLAVLAAALAAGVMVSRLPHPARAAPALLFVLAWAAALPFWAAPEVIVDAARYFTQAKHLALYGPAYFTAEWGREISAWTDLPLVPFLYGAILSLFGEGRVYIQAFTTTLFAATVVLVYLIGKTLWHERLGMHAALLMLAMPYLLTQVPLMLVDVPTMFFLMLGVFAVIRALARGGAWIALAGVVVTAAALSKYSAWLMLTAVFASLALWRCRQPAVLARLAAVATVGALGLGAFLFLAQDVVAGQLVLIRDYQAPGLGRWRESQASTLLFQIHPFVTAAAALSLYVAWRRRDASYAVIGGSWFITWVFAFTRIRYLLPAFPLLALMAAYGLEALTRERLKRLVVWCALASSAAVAAFGYLPFLRQMSAANLAEAGAFLNGLEGQTVEVFALAQTGVAINPAVSVPLLDLHTHKRIVYHDGPAPLPPGYATSPLRFTWASNGARYYGAGAANEAPIATVVIAAERGQALPPPLAARLQGSSPIASFDRSEGVFGYQTLIAVYRPQRDS